jgi:hypothetical protein
MGENRGGAREGAGRPKKLDEELANKRILRALKGVHKKESDEDNVNDFLKGFITTERGQMFIAQHLLGIPKQVNENRNMDVIEEKVGVLFKK